MSVTQIQVTVILCNINIICNCANSLVINYTASLDVKMYCNGVRQTSQLKWRKASQPARFTPYIDCAMLSQFFAYCRDSRVGSYNITVLNSYNCLFIDRQWSIAGKPTQPAKDILTYYIYLHTYSEVQLAQFL